MKSKAWEHVVLPLGLYSFVVSETKVTYCIRETLSPCVLVLDVKSMCISSCLDVKFMCISSCLEVLVVKVEQQCKVQCPLNCTAGLDLFI